MKKSAAVTDSFRSAESRDSTRIPMGSQWDCNGTDPRSGVPQMSKDDPFPPGPYKLGLTVYHNRVAHPWVILAANGQCLAGWIQSHATAVAIVSALNLQYPS